MSKTRKIFTKEDDSKTLASLGIQAHDVMRVRLSISGKTLKKRQERILNASGSDLMAIYTPREREIRAMEAMEHHRASILHMAAFFFSFFNCLHAPQKAPNSGKHPEHKLKNKLAHKKRKKKNATHMREPEVPLSEPGPHTLGRTPTTQNSVPQSPSKIISDYDGQVSEAPTLRLAGYGRFFLSSSSSTEYTRHNSF